VHPAARATHPTCFRATGHQEVAGELVDIPSHLPKRPPLLVVFHGLHESVDYVAGETGFDDIAARHRFVVAYPNALTAQRWQLNHQDGDGDVNHMRRFIPAVVKRVCADPARVYLTGFSNGGGFAWRAGCVLASHVAAIAPVSGSYRIHDPCPAGTRAMPTLEIHGVDPWTSTVARLIADTKKRNGCRHAPVTQRIARGITRTRWPGCNLERIYNRTINHEWPKLGPYNTSVEVWNFVSRFRLNDLP
jgi:polyhydroxybutyrate depolymerase